MRKIEQVRENPRVQIGQVSKDGYECYIGFPTYKAHFIYSAGAGWEHLSIVPNARRITPTWDDMTAAKEIFWNDDESVIQIHPPKDQYVNNVENCLHLWRCTYQDMLLPPSCLVGIRKGQTQAELMKEIKEAYEIAGEKF